MVSVSIIRAPYVTPVTVHPSYVTSPLQFYSQIRAPWFGGANGSGYGTQGNPFSLGSGGAILPTKTGMIQLLGTTPASQGSAFCTFTFIEGDSDVIVPDEDIGGTLFRVPVPGADGIYNVGGTNRVSTAQGTSSIFKPFSFEMPQAFANLNRVGGRWINSASVGINDCLMVQRNVPGTGQVLRFAAFNTSPYRCDGGPGFLQGVNPRTVATTNILNRMYSFIGIGANHGAVFFSWFVSDAPGTTVGQFQAVAYTPVAFDNAAIQAAFAAGLYNVYPADNGFVFGFFTNGAGPTGAKSEVAFVAPDFSSYQLLKMTPGDAATKTMLSVVPNSAYQPKLWRGTLWLAPQVPGDSYVYFSNGWGGSGVPQSDLYTYTLPCFSTCQPISVQPLPRTN